MTVRIGVSPLSWTNEDMPELGGGTPVETCLGDARTIGYAGIELGNKFPTSADTLRDLLECHQLQLVSGWYGAHLLERNAEAEIAAMRELARLLKAMGCEVMVFAELTGSVHGERDTPMSKRRQLQASDADRLGREMTAVARSLRDDGLRMAYHHHVGTVVETAEEIDLLMDACGDEVGLLLDTGHLYVAGVDPAAVVQRHAERIAHVHLKDVRATVMADARARDMSFLDAVLAGLFTVPGAGAGDYRPVFEALAAVDYAGWLVVEADQDPEQAEPREVAGLGYETVSRLARAVGLI
ncbi:MAG: myo-inosose-2 dehydratase [Myxococcota bacterium]